jgi:FixJ family two-component response regulator
VVRGLLNKQIAGELGTAEQTVKTQRSQMMRKLEVSSVAELVRLVERVAGQPWAPPIHRPDLASNPPG